MCGVAGLFHAFRTTPPELASLKAMADLMSHRGPDGEGFHAEPHVGLAHRRLAIVDLAGGAQPMATADGGIVVSFNGEIYNHVALRRELRRLGHEFRSHSDTEAILLGWREWGVDMLRRLDGMFAFALWDAEQGQLLLARDRLGEKPMHLARLPDGGWAFASEIPALLALPGVNGRLDPAALDDYLALGYVPDPGTIYAGIRTLPPAHALLLRRGEQEPIEIRYWQAPVAAVVAPAAPAEELAARLGQAVRDRLMADVPLGSFLSGGLDSGAVTAMAARALTGISTFTIGFEGASDERPVAAQVAWRAGARHHAQTGTADYLEMAGRQAALFGQPFGDHSSVPTMAVCALARRHVKVALSGDGGDEVFAGYRRHRFHSLADGVRRMLPPGMRRRVIGGLAAAYPAMHGAPRWLRARSTLTELSLDSALGYYRMVCKQQAGARRGLLSAPARAAVDGHDPSARFVALMARCDPDDPLLQAQYADIHTYLPGDILTKLDRTSMAVSLETRPPLLAHELVEWGLALPARLKLRQGVGKRVLREAMADHLPPAVLQGAKQGFAAAIGPQLRARPGALRARLTGEAMGDSGLFDLAALGRLVDEHAAGQGDHSQALWQLLVLEGFLRGQGRERIPSEAELVRS
ncbi:asparagine synthase (glutamine-hydrolyzing) [Roseococcus sp. SYP-B2431]|uniref:asparagine synthase (glutamine-hydrolyzing) n=1 Tax=Roseococcus sp. SYP-B2431 TaxID=2496640 RepID=UPI0010386D22|nr:asparagine synthase (glutamine-hydrolyzing) [Roseococcus sp. SYP-B2431]TCH96299.1 asparagine synthase (glutamine-hydrolyzing) [Roseococcus sp. SYP-B2431]